MKCSMVTSSSRTKSALPNSGPSSSAMLRPPPTSTTSPLRAASCTSARPSSGAGARDVGPSPTVTSHGEQPGGDRRHTEGQGGEFVPTLQSTRAPVLQRSLHLHVPAVGSSTGAWDTSQGRTQRRACSDVTVIHPAPHRSTLKAASLWVGASTHTVADETAVTAVTATACTKHGAAQEC